MGYSNDTKAEDVLLPTTLTISLPASALAIDGVRDLLGIRQPTAERAISEAGRGSARVKAGERSTVSAVELSSVSWDWDTERVQIFDEDGNEDTLEMRKDYMIDAGSISALSSIQHRVSQALRVLGIPHDCALFDSIESTTTVARARMKSDPDKLGDYCEDMPVPDPLDPAEILAIAKKCVDIADFTEWLADSVDSCPDLSIDAHRFDEFAALPGRSEFIEAGARIMALCSAPASQWGRDVEPKWDARIPEWIRSKWEGEDPLARFARCALPIGMPKLEKFIEMGQAQPEPDEAFIAASLSAYCVANGRDKWSGQDKRASVRAATVVGKCLGSMPQLGASLEPGAKAFFELDLEAPDERVSGASFAAAEAHWLRAQSIVARSGSRLAPSSKRLAL